MHGLLAIEKPGADEARTQRRSLQGRSAAEDGEHGFLGLARNGGTPSGASRAGVPTGEESRAQPLRGSAASGTIALF